MLRKAKQGSEVSRWDELPNHPLLTISLLTGFRIEETPMQAFLAHAPYISLLPEETLTPLHFNREEIGLLKSTPLFGHAAESRRNGRNSCIKAMRWLSSSLREVLSNTGWAEPITPTFEVPIDITEEYEKDHQFDLSREMERWGEDEQRWQVLKEWRWAETAYGR